MTVCEACERGQCWDCGMQSWCECDCPGPDGDYTFDPQEDSPEEISSAIDRFLNDIEPPNNSLPSGWWILPCVALGIVVYYYALPRLIWWLLL